MDKKYGNMFEMLKDNPEAKAYFDNLPPTVRQQISTRSFNVNSFESLRHYADNLTRGDY
ncbi:MAG: YdeI/OmpD-associated family protein [Clostridiales bacterium]|jgi:hypothetical protein|nr:YdeI/OmpD-associated family protein [Clostridiales bacterium]MCI2160509.1 YdeI/OmpD-associated family protein [Oscillospiraceae bacterium]CAB1249980.1 conserved protein of unknown function [Ruminococcaceae bacterium BL-4]MCI1960702.1 YdeI/OmpD-associated family protein [Clostridiales bacterium]MCI2021143.1 YdeI/OmpD-associated family protein [Clostridiales bacterium]